MFETWFAFEQCGADARVLVLNDVLCELTSDCRSMLITHPALLALESEALLCGTPAALLGFALHDDDQRRLTSIVEATLIRLPSEWLAEASIFTLLRSDD